MSAGNRKHPYHPPKPIEVQKMEFNHYVAFALAVIIFSAVLSYMIR